MKKFKCTGTYTTIYFNDNVEAKKPTGRTKYPSSFDLTIYRDNCAHAVISIIDQFHRTVRDHRYGNGYYQILDLHSIKVIEK